MPPLERCTILIVGFARSASVRMFRLAHHHSAEVPPMAVVLPSVVYWL